MIKQLSLPRVDWSRRAARHLRSWSRWALEPARRRPNRRAPPSLAASNTQPAFDFMTQNFVQTANGGIERHLQLWRFWPLGRGD